MDTPAAALSPEDLRHLERARVIARRGWGMVHPNPMVGCVLVDDGHVVGEGFHEVFGGAHAEVGALGMARERARGATAYVSLEPCDHQGKTPACSRALIDAGVRRVVFGAADPNREAAGGADTLRRAGVDVVGPAWSAAEGRAENPAFFHHAASPELPYVAVKLAMTLDGRISAEPGKATRITGPDAERAVHELRRGFDAVLVGAETARTDDPRLTIRLTRPGRQPLRRLVLDSRARLASDAALFEDPSTPVHVFTRTDVRESDLERLEGAGAHVHPVDSGPGGLDLVSVLGVCGDLGIGSVLCEGGGRLASGLLGQGLAQRLYLFIAPSTIGDGGVPAFPPGGSGIPWGRFRPSGHPDWVGRDALLTFDLAESE